MSCFPGCAQGYLCGRKRTVRYMDWNGRKSKLVPLVDHEDGDNLLSRSPQSRFSLGPCVGRESDQYCTTQTTTLFFVTKFSWVHFWLFVCFRRLRRKPSVRFFFWLLDTKIGQSMNFRDSCTVNYYCAYDLCFNRTRSHTHATCSSQHMAPWSPRWL